MRWTEPKDREEKIERKFAILPVKIDGETRWLEWVTIKYVYYSHKLCRGDYDSFYFLHGWNKEEFIDDYKSMK